MAARLGIVLYLVCLGISWLLGIMAFGFFVWGAVSIPDFGLADGTPDRWWTALLFAVALVAGSVVLYVLGLAIRFVLCGDSPFDDK